MLSPSSSYNAAMKGLHSVGDEAGERQAVVIDLKENREVWEELDDARIAEERADEPLESLDDVELMLKKVGKL